MTLIDTWGASMAFAGSAPNTVTTRTRALRRFERLAGDLPTRTRDDVIAYVAQYDHASTRSTVLSYLRVFYDWATVEGHVAENPCERLPKVKVPNGVPRPAPEVDVVAMLRTAVPRTRAMALLMTYCGLRCMEVAGVRHDHFRRDVTGRWWLDIARAKGGARQVVPVPSWVVDEVLAAPEWTVGPQSVQKIVRDAFRSVGSDATPHQLRHYYGTSALHQTGNLRVVQQMMRHASPATTARYTLVASSETSDAAEGLPRIA